MLAIPPPLHKTYADDQLAAIRADAEALEHALVQRRIDPAYATPGVLVPEIAVSLHEASLTAGGLAALVADDYTRDPGAFVTRMRTALWWSCLLHNAADRWGELTTGLGAIRCAHTGCAATLLELYGRRFWCATHAAEQIHDALISETGGDDDV
jgi:hypothetical protein